MAGEGAAGFSGFNEGPQFLAGVQQQNAARIGSASQSSTALLEQGTDMIDHEEPDQELNAYAAYGAQMAQNQQVQAEQNQFAQQLQYAGQVAADAPGTMSLQDLLLQQQILSRLQADVGDKANREKMFATKRDQQRAKERDLLGEHQQVAQGGEAAATNTGQ